MNNYIILLINEQYWYNLPKILDNNGNAELNISIKVQLPTMCVNGVCLICGRYVDTTGNEYKPTVEATNIYKIMTISNPAPNGPNFDRELTPKVNC